MIRTACLLAALVLPATSLAAPTREGVWMRTTTVTIVYDLRLLDDVTDPHGGRLVPTGETPERFRLDAVAPGSVFDEIGVRDGDVLVSLDARPITSAEEVLEIPEALRHNRRVSLLVERGGFPLTLTFLRAEFDGPVPRRPAPQSARGVTEPPSVADVARETGPLAYTVDGAQFDALLADPAKVSRGARLIPSRKDGAFDGFKLAGVRPSSLFAQLGLKNGDIMHRANGLSLASPQAALEAYGALRGAAEITLEITRAGAPVKLRYTIQR